MVNAVAKNADISKRRCQIFRNKPGGKYDFKALIEIRLNILIHTFNLFGRCGLPEHLLQLHGVHLQGENRSADSDAEK